jgi:dTDP-4-amino-4,6-dideoxygalactose transaminase
VQQPPRQLPSWPHFADDEINAVTEVLRSGRVNAWTGGHNKAFESEYAAYLGVTHAVAVANGTVALELGLQALGVGPGDEVVVSPRSFVASASCVVSVGATPIFADIDRQSGNLTASSIEAVLTKRTKAIIPVHLGGWPCEMDQIMDLATRHGSFVIEDCAQAHGARYLGKPVGSWGHLGAFSFCQDKIITTGGEGGLLATNDKVLWSRLWSLKDHGKSYSACFEKQWPPGFRWLHESFGGNYRLTEAQAAIGRLQLGKLADWHAKRTRNGERLRQSLAQFAAIDNPTLPAEAEHAFYRYYCYVRPEQLRPGWTRDRIQAELQALGVPCFTGSCSEVYLEKAFTDRQLGPKTRLPEARVCGETALAFLVHPSLAPDDVDWICRGAAQVLQQASA